MPILEVQLVGDAAAEGNLAQRLADAAGEVLGTPAGRTWVKLSFLPKGHYAENGAPDLQVAPVFVKVLLRQAPGLDAARATARALADGIGRVLGRPPETVHVLFEPPAAGRVAFGGTLVE